MKRRRFLVATGLAGAVLAAPAFAAEYLTVEGAQRALFPAADDFTPVALDKGFAAAQLKPARFAHMHAFAARAGQALQGYVVIDEVIGKFEYITYAVALSPALVVQGLEVLAYRESHGYEVRQAAWRRQFVGKDARAPMRVGTDIANISGATLSATHLADGVREIVAVAAAALA